ncbi:MAG: hypothetical protein K0S98_61 [Propionibacteriaceae bacterium]|nr:hypothetical protein [Propionibacteriaceae bacterium]
MIIWADGEVTAVRASWPGAVEISLRRNDRDAGAPAETRALAYTALMATPEVGDRVLLNVAALDRGLGTGGYALVIAVLDPNGRVTAQPPQPAGHLVKARYLPLQAMVAGADEQGSEHHDLLREADSIDGMPVVVADLHSALSPILLAIHHDRPGTRVVYVMTDQGALPLAFSRSVAELRSSGLLTGTVTVGQAFGGDLEAVSVHSGLLAARLALGADIAVVTQGPGNLGTGTRWGFSGVEAGEVVNAAGTLGGRPVGALRISGADQRARHHGLSHHSLTAYGRVALLPADLAVPDFSHAARLEISQSADVADLAESVLSGAASLTLHRQILVDLNGLDQALRRSPVRLSTMGRDFDGDPAYFLASAAAGRHAASLLEAHH